MPIRHISLALLLSVVSATALAQHGINLADMNPDVAACTDFYAYANGNWRAQHAIPDYMDRWSRRWESGEINKEHVRDILAEVSARQDLRAIFTRPAWTKPA
jgi:putative endopeptidase